MVDRGDAGTTRFPHRDGGRPIGDDHGIDLEGGTALDTADEADEAERAGREANERARETAIEQRIDHEAEARETAAAAEANPDDHRDEEPFQSD